MGRNVLVIGKGAREHALLWRLSKSRTVGKLFVAPGNGGMGDLAESVPIGPTNIAGLLNFVEKQDVYLTVVGPDDPLALGVVDTFQRRGHRIFGPTAGAAQIEASKAFAKELAVRQGIPTASFRTFTDHAAAWAYVQGHGAPIVIKASGLALGKGAYVCLTLDEAQEALRQIMAERVHGDAGSTVVVEEYLDGPELSAHALCDGTTSLVFPPSQDYKRIGVGDTGPNTGGMGAIMPLPGVTHAMTSQIRTATSRTLHGLRQAGHPFVGCLYPGFIMTPKGPKVLEFNARFGDPETELYMLMLQNDLLDLLDACVKGQLHDRTLLWRDGYAACVVKASRGYPGEYRSGVPILNTTSVAESNDAVLFHAGTKLEDGELVTAGGRVLTATAWGATLEDAIQNAYDLSERVTFDGAYSRSDIGHSALALVK